MKLIFIMTDTFRRDHIGAYGNRWIHTPHLDRLASMSNVFDHHYIGSFPTLPCRRDLHLGRGGKNHPLNSWKGFDEDEVTLAERLCDAGVPTMMVNDVANSCLQTRAMQNNKICAMNLNKGFEFFLGNRGQEGDNFFSDNEVPLEMPGPPETIRYPELGWHRVLMNRARRVYEEDWFAPGTFKLACQWLERNWRLKNFLLWVEVFDPHEPWDPPQYYTDRYDPGYQGRVFNSPANGLFKKAGITEREAKHIQALYAGECTMVDAAVGKLLATLDRLNLLEDTAIVFTTDHGTYLNYPEDNGLMGKSHVIGADGLQHSAGKHPKPPVKLMPQYTGVSRVPLFLHMPGQTASKRHSSITQPWDLSATVMDLFGQKIPSEFIGQSLVPVVRGKNKLARKAAVMGGPRLYLQAMNANWIFTAWQKPEGRNGYAPPPPYLIDLKNDPLQKRNVAREHPEVCRSLYREIEKFVKAQKNVPEGFMETIRTPWR